MQIIQSRKTRFRFDRKLSNFVNIPDGYAIRLLRLNIRFVHISDPLVEYIPQRRNCIYALHPAAWRDTFSSLTLGEWCRIPYFGPTLVKIQPGTLVAEMQYASAFGSAAFFHDEAEKEKWAALYKASMMPIEKADLTTYLEPELLIPRTSINIGQRVKNNF